VFARLSHATPLPSRGVIRARIVDRPSVKMLGVFRRVVMDWMCLIAAMSGIVFARSILVKGLLGVLAGYVISRLFILGHDACHHTLTRNRRLDTFLGRLLFLPSLTPYSMWELGHNVMHHGYTSLIGYDFNWRPYSPAEFQLLPRWRRALERVYRSGWAPGLYYLIEIWWLGLFFPSRKRVPIRRPIHVFDGGVALATSALWLITLFLLAAATGQNGWTLALTGFVIPYFSWCTIIGFLVFLHHVHPAVAWYEDRAAWSKAQAVLTGTVHMSFGNILDRAFYNIMDHGAHHVDMTIQFAGLPSAQATLENELPEHVLKEIFSWKKYFRIARACKLFDRTTRSWRSFAGEPTCPPNDAVPLSQ
jgi:omega-6 fatty acid desaturase (delta-12 desaturase)